MKKQVMISLCVVAALLGAAGLAGALPRQSDGGTLAQAGAPSMVSYQGQVSLDGRPFDGTGHFKFSIVDPSVPETFWSNDGSSDGGGEPELPVRLTVTGGLFNVLLGDPSVENMDQPLEAAVFAEPERCYLRVWFSEGGETFQQLSPDRRIASVPYALQADEAANANTLGGRMAGNADGRIPINNGALSSNLNADLLDGQHASYLEVPSGAMVLGLPNDSRLMDVGYTDLGASNVSIELFEVWRSTGTTNAPSARFGHTAVWTGSEMIVWAGAGSSPTYKNDGGRYDPATDTWTPATTTNAPTARYHHTAVWTGSEMLVWGGYDGGYLNDGGRYDPATDTWTPITTTSAPSARWLHTAVWTGSDMLVWGGAGSGTHLNDGGRYNPSTDTWTAISTTGAPAARSSHSAVWTGSEMLVWAGIGSSPTYKNDGGRYDPSTDTWTAMSTTNAPSGRCYHTAVWTGSEMPVWGGRDSSGELNDGGRYDLSTDTWTAIPTTNAPSGRSKHTAVWTGSEMWVWAGHDSSGELNDGGQYNPSTDSWRGMTTADAPSPRDYHTAVWNGFEMLVWGGYGSSGSLSSGGRYRCTSVLHLYWKS